MGWVGALRRRDPRDLGFSSPREDEARWQRSKSQEEGPRQNLTTLAPCARKSISAPQAMVLLYGGLSWLKQGETVVPTHTHTHRCVLAAYCYMFQFLCPARWVHKLTYPTSTKLTMPPPKKKQVASESFNKTSHKLKVISEWQANKKTQKCYS